MMNKKKNSEEGFKSPYMDFIPHLVRRFSIRNTRCSDVYFFKETNEELDSSKKVIE